MDQEKIKSKSLTVRIISPLGLIFSSTEFTETPIKIDNIFARGIIPIEGKFNNITGEAIYDFEILPDHSPLVAKIAVKSNITLSGAFEKGPEMKYYTENGGIITINYDDNFTIVNFTLQDVEKLGEKK
jgi:hypothetical protein